MGQPPGNRGRGENITSSSTTKCFVPSIYFPTRPRSHTANRASNREDRTSASCHEGNRAVWTLGPMPPS
eukprot:scaffold7401_cov36-Tisochrysis_lutea.AAC.3